ncbi:MAG: lipid-A-disaccharide synthase [Pseudomonadota bacterium]|nr:lipid-A-disaccharide synthase [Pseudomonadota bacterium]
MTGHNCWPLIYLIAGEPSGDQLGAHLMAALKSETGGAIAFRGIGGARMEAEGLESLLPIAELSVMGLAEVLPRLPILLQHIRDTASNVLGTRPDVLVTIDAPDFGLRVAKRLAGRGIPLVHYVAPSVWAWKAGRAKKMARYLDHVMTLLPFEPTYFEAHGLAASFVGHPVLESGAGDGDGKGFRSRHGISAEDKLLCLLPGSRIGEVHRLLPVFREVAGKLKSDHSDLRIVMPTLDAIGDYLRAETENWQEPPIIVTGDVEKFDAFSATNAALAASGSVGLELAAAGVPHITAYRFNWLTNKLAHIFVNTEHVHLVNVLLKEGVVPEFILENCRAKPISVALAPLLYQVEAGARQTCQFGFAMERLRPETLLPAASAAKVVLELIRNQKA